MRRDRARRVVRLKGGDPLVFARAAEECQALAAAGVPYEIVPGITAALAAGSYAGIPLTERDTASAVALVTGQEDDEKSTPTLDYTALAAFPGTLVFYMGVTSAPQWTRALIAAGKPHGYASGDRAPLLVARPGDHPHARLARWPRSWPRARCGLP